MYYFLNFLITGHTNSGFSGTFSGNGSSDNLSDDHSNTPESSMQGGAVFPNRRKKSMAQVFIDKAMPNRKKKRYMPINKLDVKYTFISNHFNASFLT